MNIAVDFPGPVWYRTLLSIPADEFKKRYWLRFRAVSYHCQIYVNDKLVGDHVGAWDTFSIEITSAINASHPQTREGIELLVCATKPSSLTAGPDSAYNPGPHPLRETLSGFLPYVWGHAFGGIWQPVEPYMTGEVYIKEAYIHGDFQGNLHIQATLSHQAPLHLTILDPYGTPVLSTPFPSSLRINSSQFTIQNFLPWSPSSPALYTAVLRVENGDQTSIRFGFRTLSVEGSILTLNKQPVYPRFILSWGWVPDRMCPDPGPDRTRADFARLKAMGYNGVKLCLWFPPQYVFEIADEMGFLLWVEFPIWMPQVTEFFRIQTPIEIERLTRLARQHPSVILYTLGCELGSEVDAGFLQALYKTVKSLISDALLTSNSGSGEAYGGTLNEMSDFYDHHFYTDPHFLPGLLDTFSPQWRTPKPWLMGEFGDYDTLRNWPRLHSQLANKNSPFTNAYSPPLWWLAHTQQGARWTKEAYQQEQRFITLGLESQGDTLERLSLQKARLHRKLTLETVRARPEISGYVITGEVDTPISTAGMWNDLGESKYNAEQFRQLNADLVLLPGFRRWRIWTAGGDRPAYSDRYCYLGGDQARILLGISHYGQARGDIEVTWQIGFVDETPFASGEAEWKGEAVPGQVCEIGLVQFSVPKVSEPRKSNLRIAAQVEGEASSSEWDFWFFPQDIWEGIAPFALLDPAGRLADLRASEADLCSGTLQPNTVGVFTMWTPDAVQFVEAGGRAILMQRVEPGPLSVQPRPFWRECLQIGVDHPAWGKFPNTFGIQFYALGTDLALETLPGQGLPLLRRLDTRQIVLEDYAVEIEIGLGKIIVTTLRLDGGLGDQPSGITRSPAGMFLLAEWLRYLQRHP